VDKTDLGVAAASAQAAAPLPRRTDGQRFRDALERAVEAAVVDLQRPLRLLAVALLARGHALIEDVPGTGKTTLARAFARALGMVATNPTLARAPAVTVRTHARRIAPTTGYWLNLLAADYERERYGAGPVSPAETRRAIRRARDLAARSLRGAGTTRR
jgi:MoxR-like ATPase